jgi:hypothetical protein
MYSSHFSFNIITLRRCKSRGNIDGCLKRLHAGPDKNVNVNADDSGFFIDHATPITETL